MSPNTKLSQQYGTGDVASNRALITSVYKQASVAGLASAFATREWVRQDLERQEAEAEALNEHIANIEANRMAPVTGRLRRTQAPAILPASMGGMVPVGMDQGMVRIASAAGADLAQMEKDAFGAGFAALGRGFGAATKGLAKGFGSSVARGANKGVASVGNFATKVKQAPGNAAAKFNNWGQQQGQKMEQWGMNKANPQPKPVAQLAPAQTAAPVQPQTPAPPANNVNTSAGAAPDKSGWLQRTGLFDNQGNFRKYKALGGAALLGAGYLGFKALKGGIDYMGQHSAPANYGTGGAQIPMGVNQYGQPSFNGQ